MGDLIDLFALAVLLAAGAGAGWWFVHHAGGGVAAWQATHQTRGTATDVCVLRGRGRAAERRLVESIAGADPDYDIKLVAALIQARNRAGLLNSQDRLNAQP